ncbi:MAG: hypothetical protein M1305_04585 [Candidatus Marsarchaeota archaeon]|nr:hypothetical protein [Candidatus Marsarchaeota archaeon]
MHTAIREVFWSEEEELFVDTVKDGAPSPVRSQVTNALAIWAGLVRGDAARRLVQRVCDKEVLLPVTPGDYRLKPDFKPQTDGIVPIGTPGLGTILALVMFDLGMDKEGLDYLREAWLPTAVNGVFAEHYVFDTNTSMCQGWSAAPVLLLPKYVLGVKPLTPGWETVEVAPHCGDLAWAEGFISTPLGEISVAWKKTDGELDVRVKVPAGMTYVLGKSENENGCSRGAAKVLPACERQGVSL